MTEVAQQYDPTAMETEQLQGQEGEMEVSVLFFRRRVEFVPHPRVERLATDGSNTFDSI